MRRLFAVIVLSLWGVVMYGQNDSMEPTLISSATYVREIPAVASMDNIIAAEVRYAVEEEMAMTLTDFFTRRASLFYWLRDGGLAIAESVAKEMATLLGWDDQAEFNQVSDYKEWVAANRFEPVVHESTLRN